MSVLIPHIGKGKPEKTVLTPRDLKFFWWLNGWGAVTVAMAAVWFEAQFSTVARRIRKLIEAGFLEQIEVAGLREKPIVLTEEGMRAARDELVPLAGIRLSTWQHDSLMCALEPRIKRRYPDGVVHPDRRIRCNRRLAGVQAGHVPDVELERPTGGAIAFELELSRKAPGRIRAIVDSYASPQQYARVYYLVPDASMAKYVSSFTDDHKDLIKVRTIDIAQLARAKGAGGD
jgi:hypothetical protein